MDVNTFNERERIAHRMAEVMAAALSLDPNAEVHRFTPSVKIGRRYVAVTLDGVNYTLTLEVDAS